MLRVKFRLIKDRLEEFRRYYRRLSFAAADLTLSLFYLFSNPYRVCRKFLQAKGIENVYVYGETPLVTLEKMVQAFGIKPEDHWLELGSGRGRTCFWMSLVWGCETRGIEWVPSFVVRANRAVRLFSLKNLEFHRQSIYEADFSWASVVFLYSTCMSEDEIAKLLICMEKLPVGAKVITVSEPLSHPNYFFNQSLSVSFPWGRTKAYLQTKKSSRFQ